MSDNTTHIGSCPICESTVQMIDGKHKTQVGLHPHTDGIIYRKVSREITPADVPEEVKREIQAEALEQAAEDWADPNNRYMESLCEFVGEKAAKLRGDKS